MTINEKAPERGNAAEAGNQLNLQASFSAHPLSAVKVWPAAGSIKRAVLDTLLAGEGLTSLDAWLRFGTSRLAGLIHQLRCEGWQIDSEIVEVDTASGRRAHVARYRAREVR